MASIADDIAKMTVNATQRASGIVIDDLAVTAENMQGIRRDRELRVVWEVAKGSFKNKMLYLVPGALALSALAPWALPPMLVGGGLYLASEGADKVHEYGHHIAQRVSGKRHAEAEAAPKAASLSPAEYEKARVDGAIRTDMVLSGEIMLMGLNTMATKGLAFKLAALPAYGVAMTAGVYGVVAGLVKVDDAGEWLARRQNKLLQKVGRGIVRSTPAMLHSIGIIGTAAMLAVGGQLVAHNLPGGVGHLLEHGAQLASNALHLTSGFATGLMGYAVEAAFGLVAGFGAERVMATGIPQRVLQAVIKPVKAISRRIKGTSTPAVVMAPVVALAASMQPASEPQAAPAISPTRQMQRLAPVPVRPSVYQLAKPNRVANPAMNG